MASVYRRHKDMRESLKDIAGLRADITKLFKSEEDRLLVLSRVTLVHIPRNPDDFVDKDQLHDKFLELIRILHPKRNRQGVRRACSKLAIDAIRFATDIWAYEVHHRADDVTPMQEDFSEFRAPTFFENGKPNRDVHGKAITQPVFPIGRYDVAENHENRFRGLSQIYGETAEEPEWMKSLKRI